MPASERINIVIVLLRNANSTIENPQGLACVSQYGGGDVGEEKRSGRLKQE